MYFSWPVTAPFYIIHLDIWLPGDLRLGTGKKVSLLNAMCDLTQFVVSTVITDVSANALAKVFMEQVVFSFGLVSVVVDDADNKFLNVFQQMCTLLKIHFWPLTHYPKLFLRSIAESRQANKQ